MAADPLFPARRPLVARQMAVGEGHLVYVEECGAPNGLQVLFLHADRAVAARPASVRGLVLRGIFLGSADEIRAYVQGSHGAAPAAWQAFAAAMPAGERADLLTAYAPVCPPQVAEKLHRLARSHLATHRRRRPRRPHSPDRQSCIKALGWVAEYAVS